MQSYGFYDYDFFPMEIGEQNKDAFVANQKLFWSDSKHPCYLISHLLIQLT